MAAGSAPGAAAAFGNSDWSRSFQVITGTSASTRESVARQHQRERPAVRPAGDAHPGIARTVLHHLGLLASQSTSARASATS